jgi:hypothetical protein
VGEHDCFEDSSVWISNGHNWYCAP